MDNIKKFQGLLEELFQFDASDLDFGIYRIMNYKRGVIERFISEDLPELITQELAQGALAGQTQATKEMEAAQKKVLAISDDAIDAAGHLIKYRDTKPGKEYLAAREKAKSAKGQAALEAAIYNHLYAFFSRYWQDGDFISKRRYSKRERYAIPYNGEEVTLYWANHDQYYIKTGEYFTDYTWKATNGVTVHFKLTAADVEQNNVKGEKRFFLPWLDEIAWDESARNLIIPFEFRPLNGQEAITYGGKNQQEAIIARAVENISNQRIVKAAPLALAALEAENRRTAGGESVTHLEHHLRQYTRRNTSDFFIHKDLRGFLVRELDFYLKNEVLNLEEMEAAGVGLSEGWFQMMRLIKKVGGHIIAFLAQIEEFQKMLWEKRKFITETFYCVTVGYIPEEYYPEIAACEAQWEEWKELFSIDEGKSGKSRKDRRVEFLKAHPTLVVDTRRFSPDPSTGSGQSFTDRLLASFDDLDEATDGLLVYSENWQALNLLAEKYREGVKIIYIDPPFNTGNDGFLYKDGYQHASWLSMMENRFSISQSLLSLSSLLFCSIDRDENRNLLPLLFNLFTENGFVEEIVWQKAYGGGSKTQLINNLHEYIHVFSPNPKTLPKLFLPPDPKTLKYYKLSDEKEPIRGKYRLQPLYSNSNDFRENLTYPLPCPSVLFEDKVEWANALKEIRKLLRKGCLDVIRTKAGEWKIIKAGTDGNGQAWNGDKIFPEKQWQWEWQRTKDAIINDEIVFDRVRGSWSINYKQYRFDENGEERGKKPQSIIIGPYTQSGTEELRNLFAGDPLKFPKPVGLLTGIVSIDYKHNNALVLDFFAGSGTTGHAVINLNRQECGRCKFILVEMAQYFDTVLLPRIKKVTFSPEWKDGKPKRMATAEEAERSPRIVKVIRLESYEDTLNNIAFDEPSGQQAMKFEDYLLQYMLKWETRKSETLLNVEKLAKPFSYQLHIHRDGETRTQAVDLPETFAYLLGLCVRKRQVFNDNDRRYLVYRGATREGRKVAVIWRETEGWKEKDYKRDKEFVAAQKLTEGMDEVYVNGDSYIPGARALEKLFKERMFAPVEV